MSPLRFFVNPDAENPTAGLRGLLALLCGLSPPLWLDWKTQALPLFVVAVGGIVTALHLFSEASKADCNR